MNERLINQNEKLIDEKNLLMKKEIYLLDMIRDALDVTEPKRFIAHRMQHAPFNPVDY